MKKKDIIQKMEVIYGINYQIQVAMEEEVLLLFMEMKGLEYSILIAQELIIVILMGEHGKEVKD